MGKLSRLFLPYLRWRHSKGYGVHSPFAFSIVQTCVSPGPYGYYGYAPVERAWLTNPNNMVSRKDAFLLLRLAINLKAKRIFIAPGKDNVAEEIAHAASAVCSSFQLADAEKYGHGDLIVSLGASVPDSAINDILAHGSAIVAFNPSKSIRKALNEGFERGMVMEGKRIMLAVPRQEMAKVYYSMKF